MNKIRVRLIVDGEYIDYEVDTKVKSESGFKDFIKRALGQFEVKPIHYRFDLIINGQETKSRMSYPIMDKRFF